MAEAKNRAAQTPTMQGKDFAWSPGANPAVAEFLDHLAGELAREYVRLMEMAAEVERAEDRRLGKEEG